MYFDETPLYYNTALINSTQFNPYIFITQDRDLGIISGSDAICYGSNTPVSYTYTNVTIDDDDYLLWRILSENGKTQYGYLAIHASDTPGNHVAGTAFSIDPSSPQLDPGDYWIKLEVISKCCGLSIPIWKKITVSQLEATIEFGN